jgi:hypothetical protein
VGREIAPDPRLAPEELAKALHDEVAALSRETESVSEQK